MKVVRFSNKMLGGTIKVPVEGTTIAGFDFDIDKLYFMRHDHEFKLDSKKAWEGFYQDNPELYKELLELRKVDKSFNNTMNDVFGKNRD